MAFLREKLTCYANNARTGVTPALWLYDNIDGDEVTEGFIKDQRIAVNDYVTVVSTSDHKRTEYYVKAVTNGAATLAAVPTSA